MAVSTIKINNDKKEAFMSKHNFTEQDIKNLIRYEEVRRSGRYNMDEWLIFMTQTNSNGGKILAIWIRNNYGEFLNILE